MRSSMSLEELSALVRIEPAQPEAWALLGLLDPAKSGRFDDLDLLRLMTIRHHVSLGRSAEQLAEGISTGEIEPFMGEYLYPRASQVTVEEAAAQTGIELDVLHDLRTPWATPGSCCPKPT